MKFFTIDWWAGCQSDDDTFDSMDAVEAYRAHLDAIRGRLPREMTALQESVSLHDATFLTLEVRGDHANLRLRLPDRRWLELCYGGLISLESVHSPDKTLDNAGYGDLGYDEVDVLADGSFTHCILFASSIELRLRFKTLELKIISRAEG